MCSYAACHVSTWTSAIAAASSRAGRTSTLLLPGDGGDVLRDRLDLRRRELALERGHDAAADRHLMERRGRRTASSWSRFGAPAARPVIPASESVWQLAARGLEDRLAVVSERCKVARASCSRSPPRPSRRTGDVDRVLAGDNVRRHLRAVAVRFVAGSRHFLLVNSLPCVRRDRVEIAEADLVEDDVLNRARVEALLPRARERVVEVRADRSARSGGLQRVAAPQFSEKSVWPARGRDGRTRTRRRRSRSPTRAAADGRDRRESCAPDRDPAPPNQPCGTPRAETASSRVA